MHTPGYGFLHHAPSVTIPPLLSIFQKCVGISLCWWTCSHSLHHCVFMPFFKFLYYHFAKVSGGSGDKHMVSLPSWPGNLLVDNGLFLIFLVIILISLNNMQIFLFVNLFITFRHYLLTSCYLNHPATLLPCAPYRSIINYIFSIPYLCTFKW